MTDSNITPIPEIEAIEDEARAWIVRLEDGDASEQELAKFQGWRAQSAVHKDTFDRLAKFWGAADIVEKLKDYGESEAARDAIKHDQRVQSKRTVWRIAAGGIAACFVGLVGINVHSYTLGANRSMTANFETAVGQQRTIALPDGSSVTLNTGSALEIDYGWRARRIVLTSGEAFFEVASKKRRPFLVETESGVVRAVGTAFSVRVDPSKLDVVVTEGRVSIAPVLARAIPSPAEPSAAVLKPVEVSARQMASWSGQVESVEPVSKRVIDKELDWRDGELVFEGETLEDIIEEVARYTDISIEVEGDELRAQRIVAYYEIGDIDPLLEALQVITGAEVTRVDERTVRLSHGASREL